MKHKFLIHRRGDYVGVATEPMSANEKVTGVYMDDDSTIELTANHDVPLGHKISLIDLPEGEAVIEYGTQIGISTCAWEVGDYVHTHNIKTARW